MDPSRAKMYLATLNSLNIKATRQVPGPTLRAPSGTNYTMNLSRTRVHVCGLKMTYITL